MLQCRSLGSRTHRPLEAGKLTSFFRCRYLNFQSFAYLCKLYIEMTMADLIRKVVRGTDGQSSGRGTSGKDAAGYAKGTSSGHKSKSKNKSYMGGIRTGLRGAYGAECRSHFELESRCEDAHHGRGESNATSPPDLGVINGIQKTVAVEVVHSKAGEEDGRRTSQGSSQRELGPCVSVESDSS